MTHEAARNHVRAGRWSLLGGNVVALQAGPLSAEQQAWYAVLDGGRHCVITGLSALHRYGLSGVPVDRVQTVVPATGTAASTDSFVRRRSRRLMPQAVHPVRRPPMTTMPSRWSTHSSRWRRRREGARCWPPWSSNG